MGTEISEMLRAGFTPSPEKKTTSNNFLGCVREYFFRFKWQMLAT